MMGDTYIGYNIAVRFVTGITLGIAYPWRRCWYQKWLCEHTVINGKRMTFDGNGGELFAKYILWFLLTWVTCGIYGLWMAVAFKKWISEHTHFEGEPDNNSFFDGTVGDYLVTSILSASPKEISPFALIISRTSSPEISIADIFSSRVTVSPHLLVSMVIAPPVTGTLFI